MYGSGRPPAREGGNAHNFSHDAQSTFVTKLAAVLSWNVSLIPHLHQQLALAQDIERKRGSHRPLHAVDGSFTMHNQHSTQDC